LQPCSRPVSTALPSGAPRLPPEYMWRPSAAGRRGTRPCAKPCSALLARRANAVPRRPNLDLTFAGDAIVPGARPRSSSAPLRAKRGSGAVAVGHTVPGPVGDHARHETANAAANHATGHTAARAPRAAVAEREQRGTNSMATAAERGVQMCRSGGLTRAFDTKKPRNDGIDALFCHRSAVFTIDVSCLLAKRNLAKQGHERT
jgi:hypothetical protein